METSSPLLSICHASRRKPGPTPASDDGLRLFAPSRPFGTLYVGSTADLTRRVWEHKIKAIPSFTAKYGVNRLVWFEVHESLAAAAQRERRIKECKRAWKIALIEKDHPHWIDLYPTLSP